MANKALFEENNSTFVIDKCVMPELHVMQGITAHLFWDGVVSVIGTEKASEKKSLNSSNFGIRGISI